MAHHGGPPDDDEMSEIMKKLANSLDHMELTAIPIGPTGRFPQGKLTKQDKGEIALKIGRLDDKIIIEFGTALTWIGLMPRQALEIATSLIQSAHKSGKLKLLDIQEVSAMVELVREKLFQVELIDQQEQ